MPIFKITDLPLELYYQIFEYLSVVTINHHVHVNVLGKEDIEVSSEKNQSAWKDQLRPKLFTDHVRSVCRYEMIFRILSMRSKLTKKERHQRHTEIHQIIAQLFGRFWKFIFMEYVGHDVYEFYQERIRAIYDNHWKKAFSDFSRFKDLQLKQYQKTKEKRKLSERTTQTPSPSTDASSTEKFSIPLIGDGGCGRRSLHLYFSTKQYWNEFDYDRYYCFTEPTRYEIDSKACLLDIDTILGMDELSFQTKKDIFSKSHGIIGVCSINSMMSIEILEEMMTCCINILKTRYFPVVICLNKSDLESDRYFNTVYVEEQVGQKLRLKNYCIIETCAKEGKNVDQAFFTVVRKCREYYGCLKFHDSKALMGLFLEELESKKTDKNCLIM